LLFDGLTKCTCVQIVVGALQMHDDDDDDDDNEYLEDRAFNLDNSLLLSVSGLDREAAAALDTNPNVVRRM